MRAANRIGIGFFPLLGVGLAFGISASAAPFDGSSQSAPKTLAALPDRWKGAMGDLLAPGFAVVVVQNDEVVLLDALGERDPQRGLPATPDTAYYIASATKPFVAMAVMALVDDGRVELDAPVQRYLPRFQLPDSAYAARVTVRDLLCHRPGINAGGAVFLDAYTGEITEDRYYHFLLHDADVAKKTRYSNIHFTLLGRLIERVTGKTWQAFLTERIFVPAGMHRTTPYADDAYAWKNVAIPQRHTSTGGFRAAEVRKTNRTMHAAGGLITTARDLGQWLKLNINRGMVDGKRIVSAERVEEMFRLQAEIESSGRIRVRQGFGLGWGRGTYRGRQYAFHDGGYVGAAAHTSFLIDDRIGVCALTNAGGPASAFVEAIVSIDVYDRLLNDIGRDLLPAYRKQLERQGEAYLKSQNPPSRTLQASALSLSQQMYVGVFVDRNWGTLRVESAGDALRARWGDMPVALVAGDQPDHFTLICGGGRFAGQFETADGQVRGVAFPERGIALQREAKPGQ